MCHVLVQIGDTKQQLQNLALLHEIPRPGDFRERIQSDVNIRKKPLERRRVNHSSLPAFLQRSVSPRKCLIKKVIETQARNSKRWRHFLAAMIDVAVLGLNCRHKRDLGLPCERTERSRAQSITSRGIEGRGRPFADAEGTPRPEKN
jgi:hypothetical protein